MEERRTGVAAVARRGTGAVSRVRGLVPAVRLVPVLFGRLPRHRATRGAAEGAAFSFALAASHATSIGRLERRRFGAPDTQESHPWRSPRAVPGAGRSGAPNLRHSLHEIEDTNFVEVHVETIRLGRMTTEFIDDAERIGSRALGSTLGSRWRRDIRWRWGLVAPDRPGPGMAPGERLLANPQHARDGCLACLAQQAAISTGNRSAPIG